MFSEAQYNSTITKLNDGINKIPPIANAAAQRFAEQLGNPATKDVIDGLINELFKLVEDLLNKVEEWAKTSDVPIAMWNYGGTWTAIQQSMSDMAGDIAGQTSPSWWKGSAADAYGSSVSSQASAVQEIASLSGTIQSACGQVAEYGIAFYVSLLGVVVGLIVALTTAGTVVGALAGAGVAIAGALAAVATFAFGVESQVRVLQGCVAGNAAFPGRKWPVPTTS